ncbi:hypothetical protein OGAPHI_001199 [Ogataea philodendri]|uniref:poly(A)-specific ribonuclease n=1 Tax=Ogataea philodendri TaxID=1378263 RepID=A0A9P8T9K2_9ASCO|nr:uncharacterized protein OGAPHI_001199 [Ogataea philodendri]KAH3670684.1 hypothetical protein OGAPHI_001199 [Ogataea philodendri]
MANQMNMRFMSQFLNNAEPGQMAAPQKVGSMMSPQVHNRSIQQQVLAATLQQQQQQQLLQQVQQQQAVLAAQRLSQQHIQKQPQPVQAQPMVREVWKDNLESEMMVLRELAERYNYICVSTEFAGIVARPIGSFRSTKDYHYQTVRSNADLLNLIQIGITLSDKDGRRPEGVPSTWQFNFRFDLDAEMFSRESVESLITTGLNFSRLKEFGIDVFEFAQALTDSGLCLMKDNVWVSYHAGYDFGFIISLLINRAMPMCEEEFEEWLSLYFPTFYDIKYVSVTRLGGAHKTRSLETLAEELGVIRNVNHNLLQVGGQSMLTHLCFWEMRRLVGDKDLAALSNQIWGFVDDKAQFTPEQKMMYLNR